MALITNPDALEKDATTLEQTAFGLQRDEAKALIAIAGKLRRAAELIRSGKIKGIPSR